MSHNTPVRRAHARRTPYGGTPGRDIPGQLGRTYHKFWPSDSCPRRRFPSRPPVRPRAVPPVTRYPRRLLSLPPFFSSRPFLALPSPSPYLSSLSQRYFSFRAVNVAFYTRRRATTPSLSLRLSPPIHNGSGTAMRCTGAFSARIDSARGSCDSRARNAQPFRERHGTGRGGGAPNDNSTAAACACTVTDSERRFEGAFPAVPPALSPSWLPPLCPSFFGERLLFVYPRSGERSAAQTPLSEPQIAMLFMYNYTRIVQQQYVQARTRALKDAIYYTEINDVHIARTIP